MIAPTQIDIETAVRSFLLSILSGIEVVVGQENRVPEPVSADFIVMTTILSPALSTNVDTYNDGFPGPTTESVKRPTEIVMQLDVHGPNSADNVRTIAILFRDDIAVQQFATSGLDIAPLYADDPRQTQFVDGEKQYEKRWTVDIHLQSNEVVTVTQQFAAAVKVGLIEVDTTYPP